MSDERSLTNKETGGLRNRRGRNIKSVCCYARLRGLMGVGKRLAFEVFRRRTSSKEEKKGEQHLDGYSGECACIALHADLPF